MSTHYYRNDEEIRQDRVLACDHGIVEENYNRRPSENSQKFAQPLPSPLHSPTRHQEPPKREPMTARSASKRSNGSVSSEEDNSTRSVAVSVIRDSGTKVELMLKAHGLKKKKSLFNSFVTVFRKPSQPSRLLANGKFTDFVLKSHSLRFLLDVQTNKKKKKGNGNRVDTFICEVKQFPTEINPDSAEFEVLEPASGEAFILLSLIKTGNLSVNWKEFLDSNGTIDVSCI